jgi:hypothetical protein
MEIKAFLTLVNYIKHRKAGFAFQPTKNMMVMITNARCKIDELKEQ